ncbi:MAG: D-sedoheptulose 7-phosphate isomerase [Candidatus Omnitrophica bacterium]|nr:D-sedoheptulose 7-phosphate isomerase [Candidatus Omnitrophota bacterium]MDD5310694.1 D-sedoheptulose 7-phosphate isomerase [Candidatus Omnitrophota bacterium]MDD5545698.1 D-sedoheptulose 7-phosphate isomerase [Candidatus Omnitrophota bacterium]
MKKKIESILEESISVKKDLLVSQAGAIEKAADAVIKSLKSGGKVIIFGNGGSAADSQHMAAELVGKFLKERKGVPAVALTTNTSIITAIANDYSYDEVFSRQLDAIAGNNDVAVGISTSGNAKNVIKAVELANKKGLVTVALTGRDGGGLARIANIPIIVPSGSTPRIQEAHVTVVHILCQLAEEALF